MANLRSLGIDLELLDIISGTEILICALRAGRAIGIQDFYVGLFEEENTSMKYKTQEKSGGLTRTGKKQIFGGNIQTAEQFGMLARSGFVIDNRKKNKDAKKDAKKEK